MADDAAFSPSALAPGTYTLAVSEFFNFTNGNLSDDFFEAGQGNFTGRTCTQPGAAFLQPNMVSDQRLRGDVSATAVPEPATYALLILSLGALGAALRARRRPALAAAFVHS